MKRAGAKIVPKLLNFEQKQLRMDIAQEMLTTVNDVQRRSNFAEKGYNWWRIIGVWLRYWNQNPILPMESVLLQLRR